MWKCRYTSLRATKMCHMVAAAVAQLWPRPLAAAIRRLTGIMTSLTTNNVYEILRSNGAKCFMHYLVPIEYISPLHWYGTLSTAPHIHILRPWCWYVYMRVCVGCACHCLFECWPIRSLFISLLLLRTSYILLSSWLVTQCFSGVLLECVRQQ